MYLLLVINLNKPKSEIKKMERKSYQKSLAF